MQLSRRQWIVAASGALLATYPVFIERYLVQVNEYEVPVPHLPPAFEGYRIAQISDTHLGLLVSSQFIQDVVTTTNDIGADLIVGTGDFVHHTRDEVRAVWPLLSRLRARDGVCAVLGNHDLWADDVESRRRLVASGFSVHHGVRTIERRGQRLLILGAGDFTEDVFGIDALLQEARPEDCRVVLAHNPDSADAPRGGRVDLMLSGHTHGGQVRVPGLGAPILAVNNKDYDQGFKQAGSTSLFISRGIGWAIAPVRFACAPEIPVLTLIRA